jgi:hypothetical protein
MRERISAAFSQKSVITSRSGSRRAARARASACATAAGAALQGDDADSRWDRASVHAFSGAYGEYLLAKGSRVFPQLRDAVLHS